MRCFPTLLTYFIKKTIFVQADKNFLLFIFLAFIIKKDEN